MKLYYHQNSCIIKFQNLKTSALTKRIRFSNFEISKIQLLTLSKINFCIIVSSIVVCLQNNAIIEFDDVIDNHVYISINQITPTNLGCV